MLFWEQYKKWLLAKYSKHYADVAFCYSKKYAHLINNVKEIAIIPTTNQNNVIKSLTVLSKYLGKYEQYKLSLKNNGIKAHTQNGIESFLRIFNASDKSKTDNITEWLQKINKILKPNERLFIKFLKETGIRTDEAIKSFNLIIELANQNKLDEYYSHEYNCLLHFKYAKLFLRGTKNVYLSFVDYNMVQEIASSTPLTYNQLKMRFQHNQMPIRLNELRDQFATKMLESRILEQEVNLLQGRVNGIIVKHYWSPRLRELGDRVFNALSFLDVGGIMSE